MIPYERRGNGQGHRGGRFESRSPLIVVTPSTQLARTSTRIKPRTNRALWLIAPLVLLCVLIGVEVIEREHIEVFSVAFAVLLSVGAGWILMSVFGADAARECRACGARTASGACPRCEPAKLGGEIGESSVELERELGSRRLGDEHRRW